MRVGLGLVKEHDVDLKRRQPHLTDNERLTAAIDFADGLGYELTELMTSVVSSMFNERTRTSKAAALPSWISLRWKISS